MSSRKSARSKARLQILREVAALGPSPDCDCVHSDQPCDQPADFRVTVLCEAEDCDGAVWTHLVCGDCLPDWMHDAREHGWRVRVREL